MPTHCSLTAAPAFSSMSLFHQSGSASFSMSGSTMVQATISLAIVRTAPDWTSLCAYQQRHLRKEVTSGFPLRQDERQYTVDESSQMRLFRWSRIEARDIDGRMKPSLFRIIVRQQ